MIIRISIRTALLLECQRALFRQKFGREAEAEDPLFFDPGEDEPQPIIKAKHASVPIEQLCQRLSKAGVDPAFLFAIRKTMQLGLAAPPCLYSDAEVVHWLGAVDRYHRIVDARGRTDDNHVACRTLGASSGTVYGADSTDSSAVLVRPDCCKSV